MRVYLVGGAVRDKLLGLEVKERDWVVVGATVEEMLASGYKQVGKGFPVFLHPQTKEQYALARKEQKIAAGHTGFACISDPTVALEEDLWRRDLTVNAMAETADGTIIDPYGGGDDLAKRVLRHVSDAFVEDPLRVLRVARFATRFANQHFVIAEETMALMGDMVASKELQQLPVERIWQEFKLALQCDQPQVFIRVLKECGALELIMTELQRLYELPAQLRPGEAEHAADEALLALQEAVALSPLPQVRFAALTHRLGAAAALVESTAEDTLKQFCVSLKVDKKYYELARMVSNNYLLLLELEKITARDLEAFMMKQDALRRGERFNEFMLSCDAIFRVISPQTSGIKNIVPRLQEVLGQCAAVTKSLPELTGYSKQSLGKKMRALRVVRLTKLLEKWRD